MFKYISTGHNLQDSVKVNNKSDKGYLKLALNNKLKGKYSDKYKSMLRFVYDGFVSHSTDENIGSNGVKSYLNHYALGVSYNTIKRHLNVLINEARNIGMNSNPMDRIKAKKTKAKLHKPYKNINLILDEIKLFEQDQTLYSFRHSGAIEIFKRTGSITKLQKAMGHSSINVSLTYLRGLEIAELKEEDMPRV